MTPPPGFEQLLRDLAPQVLTAVCRRFGDFALCEDAVQEALLSAAVKWPEQGLPDNPRSWLITAAARRRIDIERSESARRQREHTAAGLAVPQPEFAPAEDDTLTLLMLCCHPELGKPSQLALTLRAVGGLTTAEIGRALLVPEKTVSQRINRAKKRLSGARFRMPPPGERAERMTAVLQVLYLIFTEGHTASSGTAVNRVELTAEAIRLTRQLHTQVPDDGEVAGLLALMLLSDARRPARTRPDGAAVPLAEQDRTLWDAAVIAEGLDLIGKTLVTAQLGPYQLEAAIAAVHDEAARAEDTDWPQILALYDLLLALAPSPVAALNRIVPVAMVHGAREGLRQLDEIAGLDEHHRVDVVRAHLLDLAGEPGQARVYYRSAARKTLSVPERRYLESRAAKRKSP
ncbi:RNA polymerase sigma factor [Amycolatopsis dendrobii]|uniref:Sigma-70 family RNA polymerase sigma factor n=1 Tax=Amycolatopsis dendrobii TaxID=2760662 RepID=A0A7W3ZBM6_9PSEU|nr:sigma-70 family RNA polymerase sigma factor [Amycolatopsis dendrobii]MBB1155007.1 sigma-70 family RNA polymerase sigma factor [Amycolatopsis dendrobii]